MIIVYINPKDTNPNHDQNITIDILKCMGVEFITTDLHKTQLEIIRKLTQKMRENRKQLSKVKGPNNKWDHDSLILPPVMEVGKDAYPWWYIRERLDEIIRYERIQIPTKPKLKIKRITNNKNTKDQIELDLLSLARINVTMLALVNRIDPIDIMCHWPMGERAAGMIMWRLAQHYKSFELNILADMLSNKAQVADPYAKRNNVWIGDEMYE
jgi:hypothetical protein